jgi:hypothetical protein
MLRTNSKKALANVEKFILDGCDFDGYGFKTPSTPNECMKAIYDVFVREKYSTPSERSQNEQATFVEWLQGLPSIIDASYYYNVSAVETLGDILEETKEERARFSETQAERLLSYMIYRRIRKAIK